MFDPLLSFRFTSERYSAMRVNLIPLAAGIISTVLSYEVAIAQPQDMEQQRVQEHVQHQEREQIYGYDLMTEQERAEHREQMRSMKTEQEREAYRIQHHEEMQRRAGARGVELQEPMPARGQGKGQGKHQDQGKGWSQGQGPGNPGQRPGGSKGGGK
jgi:DNA primase